MLRHRRGGASYQQQGNDGENFAQGSIGSYQKIIRVKGKTTKKE